MAQKNWIIDLSCDFDTKEQEELMLTAVRTAAKELHATAQLLANNRRPKVAIHNKDMYQSRDKVDLFTAEEKAEYGL